MRNRTTRTGAEPESKSLVPWKTYATITMMVALLLWAVEHPDNFFSQLIRVIFAP